MISQFSCVLMRHKYDEFDKHNNLFTHEQLQVSVNKALNKNRNITQTLVEFRRTACWMSGNIILSFSEYFSSNTFSQNIKYCSVAFSLLFSIA